MVGIPPILAGLNWSGWNTNHVVGNPTCAHGEEILIVAAFSNFTKICILKRSFCFKPIGAEIQRRSKWNWPQKSNKNNVFLAALVGFPTTKTVKIHKIGQNNPKTWRNTSWASPNVWAIWYRIGGFKKKDWKTAHKKSCLLKLKYGVWWSGGKYIRIISLLRNMH